MTRERWGTFSVTDHNHRRAFIADVLLYDRLIIPYPPDDIQRKDWAKAGWAPGRLDWCLDILGDHAIRVPWTQEKREHFKTRYQAGQAARFDTDHLAHARETHLDPLHLTRLLLTQDFLPELPKDVSKVWVMPAYPSLDEFKKDLPFDVEKEQERRQKLQCALSHRFLVPTGIFQSHYRLLKKAVQLADDDDFKGHRADFYKWQEDVIEQDISVENAVKEMEKHLEKLNEIVRKAKIKVYWKFAFTIIPIGLAGIGAVLATSPLAIPLFGAGALVSIAKFAKFDRNPEYQVSEHATAVMFHDTRTLSG